MPLARIKIGPYQQSGQEELSGGSRVNRNVVSDKLGTIRRRPGINTYSEAPSSAIDAAGIEGLWITNDDVLYAVGGYTYKREIYKIKNGAAVCISNVPQGEVQGSKRPVFAETEAMLAIASGMDVQKIIKSTEHSSRLGGSPPRGTHIAANSLRLLLNNPDNIRVYYSDISIGTSDYSGNETWGYMPGYDSGWITAESRPDPIRCIGDANNEIYVWGTSSVQIYAPDYNNVYAPVTTLDVGTLSPYSMIRIDDKYAWFDQRRRFIISNGRGYDIISEPIQQTLMGLTAVDDCYGYRINEGPIDCLVWAFPTDGRTYVYQEGVGWGQWDGYEQRFPVSALAYRNSDATNIVGTTDGKVGRLVMGYAYDGTDPINAYAETGFESHETDMYKTCKSVSITMRRGETVSSTAPVAFLSWADAPDRWMPNVPVDLGYNADRETTVTLRSLGTYKRRKWRFTFSGTEDIALSAITENYSVLEE